MQNFAPYDSPSKTKAKDIDIEEGDDNKGDEPENINDRKHGGKYTQYED